jgi:hypothetical protein
MPEQFVGLRGVASLLGMTQTGARARARKADFPSPQGFIDGKPFWTRSDIVSYARVRILLYEERPAVAALAREPVREPVHFSEVIAAGRDTR